MFQMGGNITGILGWGHQHGRMETWSRYRKWVATADPAISRAGARASSWCQGMPHCSSSLSAVTGSSDRVLESFTDFNSSWNSLFYRTRSVFLADDSGRPQAPKCNYIRNTAKTSLKLSCFTWREYLLLWADRGRYHHQLGLLRTLFLELWVRDFIYTQQ